MNFNTYIEEFEQRAEGNPIRPVLLPENEGYTKLNYSRTSRWLKKGELKSEVLDSLKNLKRPLDFILITEPWCGDAAHSVPFIQMMVGASGKINMEIYLRDEYPELIKKYHTNGAHSIPKLIVRDQVTKEDLFIWGPRPLPLAEIMLEHKGKLDPDELSLILQKWYNEDKGNCVQDEILKLLKTV